MLPVWGSELSVFSYQLSGCPSILLLPTDFLFGVWCLVFGVWCLVFKKFQILLTIKSQLLNLDFS
jgi:hypothetical protein